MNKTKLFKWLCFRKMSEWLLQEQGFSLPWEKKRYTFISESSGWKLGGKPHMNQSLVPVVTRPQTWNHWVLPQSTFSNDFCASSLSSFRRHHSVFEALRQCRHRSREMTREYSLGSPGKQVLSAEQANPAVLVPLCLGVRKRSCALWPSCMLFTSRNFNNSFPSFSWKLWV